MRDPQNPARQVVPLIPSGSRELRGAGAADNGQRGPSSPPSLPAERVARGLKRAGYARPLAQIIPTNYAHKSARMCVTCPRGGCRTGGGRELTPSCDDADSSNRDAAANGKPKVPRFVSGMSSTRAHPRAIMRVQP